MRSVKRRKKKTDSAAGNLKKEDLTSEKNSTASAPQNPHSETRKGETDSQPKPQKTEDKNSKSTDGKSEPASYKSTESIHHNPQSASGPSPESDKNKQIQTAPTPGQVNDNQNQTEITPESDNNNQGPKKPAEVSAITNKKNVEAEKVTGFNLFTEETPSDRPGTPETDLSPAPEKYRPANTEADRSPASEKDRPANTETPRSAESEKNRPGTPETNRLSDHGQEESKTSQSYTRDSNNTTSIKDVLKRTINEPVARQEENLFKTDDEEESLTVNEEINDFTEKELVNQWKIFANHIRNKHPRLYNTLLANTPSIISQTTIGFVISNPLQKEALNKIKPQLLSHLRRKLNKNLDITVTINENLQGNRLYLPEDKYEHMVKKNSDLAIFRQKFNLDFE